MRCRSVSLVQAVQGPDAGRDLWTELVVGASDPDPRKPKVRSIELIPAGYLVTGATGNRMLIPHANVRYAHLLSDEVVEAGPLSSKVVSMPTRRKK